MHAADLDENLIILMAQGDGDAFTEFYNQTAGIVYGFALSILRNKQDAEDVMHDAFIKAYTSAVTYRPMGKPVAWLLTIVKNLCYNRIRSGRIFEDIDDYQDAAVSELQDQDTVTDRAVLQQALSILDADERQIVTLYSVSGMKHREIAEIMDMPMGTVLSKYNRALAKMRKELTGDGDRNRKGGKK
jgi:RNA polymerase sigma-70 factor (ECF subfamily)